MFWDGLRQDLRFSIRHSLRWPGISVVAIATLGLGIGVNVAIFSVLKAILIQPLPYPEPDRLVRVWKARLDVNEQSPLSDLNYLDLREHNTVFAELGVYGFRWANLSGHLTPERIRGSVCTASFLRALGLAPQLGRFFTEEEQVSGARVVLLSHTLWKTRFGGEPGIVGRPITLDRESYTVIGVMPEGYGSSLPWVAASSPELWLPLKLSMDRGRGWNWLSAIGRLEPGTTLDVAAAQLDVTSAGLVEVDSYYSQRHFVISPLRNMVRGVGPTLWTLQAAVGLLLVLVCANITSMLLARFTDREAELAVRTSLGAGRGRLTRQLLTESLVLSVVGGTVGVLLAWWGVGLLRDIMPSDVPRILGARIDIWVLVFGLAVTMVAAVVSGLSPAIAAFKFDVMGVLREGRGGLTAGPRGMRTHNLLLVGQFAVALTVANVAGLMLKSLYSIVNEPVHFDAENVLSAGITLQGSGYERGPAKELFWNRLLERARLLPGVESASLTTLLPLEGGSSASFIMEGEKYDPEARRPYIEMKDVTPDYFRTMVIPIIQGRTFREVEMEGSSEVVVNRVLSERYWPNDSAVGKHIYSNTSVPEWTGTIVGVAENVRQYGREYPVIPEIYFPFEATSNSNSYVLLKTGVDPHSIVAPLRGAVAELDPHLPLSRIRTMDEVMSSATAERRVTTNLILVFAIVAVGLVGVGTYGVMSYYVAQRIREIGIRMALGAERRAVVNLFVRRALVTAITGVGLGAVLAVPSAALTRHLMFDVSPFAPLVTIGVALFVILIALVACVVPTLRALQVDPVSALRVQ
ncbi:MAG: ABC transporter permease [Gemmatimonadales bacterium]|jgi:predicted permease